jgi:hypothetical protein
MHTSKVVLFLLTAILTFSALAAPVLAIGYAPGVSVGQYAKYGNFIGVGPGEETINNTDFVKQEVIAVSGTQITLFTTGQLKDGSPTQGNGSTTIWDIQAGTSNGTPMVQGPIVAANLNQGDTIPPPNTYTVNRTETRTYLGTSRTVNVLNPTIITPDYTTTFTFVYDRASGILLEATSITIQNQATSTPSEYSYIITQTNIFEATQTTPTPSPSIPEYSSFTIAVVAILATLLAALLKRKTAKIRQ